VIKEYDGKLTAGDKLDFALLKIVNYFEVRVRGELGLLRILNVNAEQLLVCFCISYVADLDQFC
jgi:hypothetical protein